MVGRLRRKLAIASWGPPREGNIHGKVTVDATEALAYLEDVRERTGEKVTITHLVPHDQVALTFLVSMPDGSDLAKARIDHIDRKPLTQVAAELRQAATDLRDGRDENWEKNKQVISLLPTWLLRPLLWLTGLLASSFGVNAPALGVEPFPFGSGVVTSVGMFGLDEAYVPQTPFARVPLWVLVGAVSERPAVVDGQIVARPQLTVTATIDHRFVDGCRSACGHPSRHDRRALAPGRPSASTTGSSTGSRAPRWPASSAGSSPTRGHWTPSCQPEVRFAGPRLTATQMMTSNPVVHGRSQMMN